MKNFNWDSFYKIAKIFALVLISVSIAYYLIIFLPKKEAYKREAEEKAKLEQIAAKEKEDFQKKNADCLSNSERIKNKIQDDNATEMDIFGIKLFGDIFYSPRADSCVYIIKTITPDNFDNSSFSVISASTDRVIESTGADQEDYDRLIAKYKNSNQ